MVGILSFATHSSDRWLQHLHSGHSYEFQFHCCCSSQVGLLCRDTAHHPGRWDQFPGQRRHL